MRQIREALGDDAGMPQYIGTLPRRGYRFLWPVETAQRDLTAPTRLIVLPFRIPSRHDSEVSRIRE